MGRQQFFHLLGKPLIRFILLAVWAMAVAAAAVDQMQIFAFAAFIHHCAKGAVSALNDIPDGFFMGLG